MNMDLRNTQQPFWGNYADFCVGTGRMGLALHEEYLKQLEKAQKEIGFQYIRGHGLFSDDMGIFHAYQDENGQRQVEYNWTYLDRVMDAYQRLNIKPFFELGFMPYDMASGSQLMFYWKGNVTPPQDHSEWANLIKAMIVHLVSRYGEREVATWPVEVWNEPNLAVFWENADLEAYFKLYEVSVKAVKEALPQMRVGGPAICGIENCHDWMRAFLQFCQDKDLPLDFVTRHAYMAEEPIKTGHYVYHTMRTVQSIMDEMQATRDIIDSFPKFKGMEMHITEFNTSYSPLCPIHDTCYNAALVAGLLARLGEVAASYSYWTFGDVFEENGVPFTPFHGGFGLLANESIEKPTYWTYKFFKQLQGACVLKWDSAVVTKGEDGIFHGVLWAIDEKEHFSLALPKGEYCLVTNRVGDPRKAWHDLGQPANPSKEETEIIKACAKPNVQTAHVIGEVSIQLYKHDVVYFQLRPVQMENDRGFDYDWYKKEQ